VDAAIRRAAGPVLRVRCCGSGAEARRLDLAAGSYTAEELTGLPEETIGASLGCGNPTALATLSPGEVVLDLGSGGGIDVLLSARRVSPGGKAYGVDMTHEMLELKDAGLVREERRGKWSFYSLDREAARDLLVEARVVLSA
jgi:arsenite methyltransferase